jgi:hypothetical protein
LTTFNTYLHNVFQPALSSKQCDYRYRSSSPTLFRRCFYVFDILQSRPSAGFRTGRDHPDSSQTTRVKHLKPSSSRRAIYYLSHFSRDLAYLAVGGCVAILTGPALTGDGYASRQGAGHVCCKVAGRAGSLKSSRVYPADFPLSFGHSDSTTRASSPQPPI